MALHAADMAHITTLGVMSLVVTPESVPYVHAAAATKLLLLLPYLASPELTGYTCSTFPLDLLLCVHILLVELLPYHLDDRVVHYSTIQSIFLIQNSDSLQYYYYYHYSHPTTLSAGSTRPGFL